LAQIEGEIIVKVGSQEEYTEVKCKRGENFYHSVNVGGKFYFPCEKCPYFSMKKREWSLFGIGGSIGGAIFKQTEEAKIKKIESIDLKCRKYNLEKSIKC